MKQLRHILSVSLIALATMLLLAHNIIPHHHSAANGVTTCIDHKTTTNTSIQEAIVPCNPTSHSCSHASHHNEHFCSDSNHCNHSLCTLLYEFLSNSNSMSHNQLATLILFQYIAPDETVFGSSKHQFVLERNIPLDNKKFFRDTPRRAPPVA